MSLSLYSAIDNGDTVIDMLKQALENWLDWGLPEKPSLIRLFNNGLNHHTGLIESAGERFVLKVFEHSFSRTIAVEYWAAELAISPTLYVAANNIALYEFIEDQGYTVASLNSIAQTLTTTHQSPAPLTEKLDLFSVCDTYLSNANTGIYQWHSALMPLLTEFIEDPTPWVFCHNDLVTQNCLFKSGSTVLIDWEFAQHNNPWFDLAAIIHYFKLNDSQAQTFLSSYKPGWQQKIKDRIFHTSQIAVLWCDLLWSMQTLGADYQSKNAARFAQLRKLSLKVGVELPVLQS